MNKVRLVLERSGLDILFLIIVKVSNEENPIYYVKIRARRHWKPPGPQERTLLIPPQGRFT